MWTNFISCFSYYLSEDDSGWQVDFEEVGKRPIKTDQIHAKSLDNQNCVF